MVSLLIVYKTKQGKAENWDVLVNQEKRANEGSNAGLGQYLPLLYFPLGNTICPSCLQISDPLPKGKKDV